MKLDSKPRKKRTTRHYDKIKGSWVKRLKTDKAKKLADKVYDFIKDNGSLETMDVVREMPEFDKSYSKSNDYIKAVLARYPHIQRRRDKHKFLYYYQE